MFLPSEFEPPATWKDKKLPAHRTSSKRANPRNVHKLPLECSQFEEALILAEESRLSTTTEWRKLRSHPPRANCRKTKPSSGHEHVAGIGIPRFRCEISAGRKNCPSRLEGICRVASPHCWGPALLIEPT